MTRMNLVITLPKFTEKFCHFGTFELQGVSVMYFAFGKIFSFRSIFSKSLLKLENWSTVIVGGVVLRCISLAREDTSPANNSGWSVLWLFICWVSWPVRGRSAGKGGVDSSLVTMEFCIVTCVLRISLCFWDSYKTQVKVASVKFNFCQTPLVNIQVLSDITPCWLVNSYRVFRRACCHHHQGVHRPLNLPETLILGIRDLDFSLMWDTLSARTWCKRQLSN